MAEGITEQPLVNIDEVESQELSETGIWILAIFCIVGIIASLGGGGDD